MGSHASVAFPEDVRRALDAFRQIVQALRTAARDTERHVGLSTAQLFALQQLANAPGSSVNDLAARTFTHQSSVSVVVQRLVQRRLVQKVTAKEDRRRVRLALTESGRTVLRRSPEPVQDKLIAGLAALPEDRRHLVADALDEIAQTINGREAPPPMLFEDGRRGRPGRRRRKAVRKRR